MLVATPDYFLCEPGKGFNERTKVQYFVHRKAKGYKVCISMPEVLLDIPFPKERTSRQCKVSVGYICIAGPQGVHLELPVTRPYVQYIKA